MIVVALQNTTLALPGSHPVVVRKGEAWDDSAALVKAHPAVFSADPGRARGDAHRVFGPDVVESATRAPGERSKARRG